MATQAIVWLAASLLSMADPIAFERVEVDGRFPEAYQVEIVDVDGDKKPDIVALGGDTIAWYQNPTWKKRVIATGGDPLRADLISSASVDLDGDGRAEVAIACDFAMNTPTRGQLYMATQGNTIDDPWTFRKVGDFPSIHRIRWSDIDGNRSKDLVVAPIFGPMSRSPTYDQDEARVVAIEFDELDPLNGKRTEREIMRRPVVHAVRAWPTFSVSVGDQQPSNILGGVMTADNTGLSEAIVEPDREAGGKFRLAVTPKMGVIGASGPAPKRGCSEVQWLGLRKSASGDARTASSNEADRYRGTLGLGRLTFATIEPWHGSDVAIWRPRVVAGKLEPAYDRTVIDDTLDEGHALCVADVDGDLDEEVFAGHRGKDHRVSMYRLGADGKTWTRTVIDTGVAAQDLKSSDIDGDGDPDIVAVGGSTHNVVLYRTVGSRGFHPR